MLSVEAELSLIQLLLFSPQLPLVFQISSSLFSLLVPLQKFTCCPFNSPFSPFLYISLLFSFLIRKFFQISFVVLPKFCCSPSTIILFYHTIVDPRVFCSFCNIPLSLSTIVSFFSHNYVIFYSQLKFLHNALVLFPRIILSASIRFCSSLTKLLFIYQCSIVFFHNSIV